MKKTKILTSIMLTCLALFLPNWVLWGQVIDGPTAVCLQENSTYTALPGAGCSGDYSWQITPPSSGSFIGGNNAGTVEILWQLPGVAQLCLTDNSCPPPACIIIAINEPSASTEQHVLCTGECITCAGQEFCAPGTYQVNLTNWLGCDSLVTCVIISVPPISTNLGTVVLGCNESLTVCGEDFSSSGSFSVVCQSWLGCDSTVSFQIQQTFPVVANAGPDLAIACNLNFLTLAGSGSTGPEFIYNWTTTTGNVISGDLTLTPVVNMEGEYCLTVLNTATGCAATNCMIVTATNAPPFVDAGPDIVIECNTTSIPLQPGISANPNYQYVWTGPNGFTSTQLQPTVTLPGIYCLTVTDIATGCSAVDCMVVTQNIVQPIVIISPGGVITVPCDGSPIFLDGTGSSAGPEYAYLWLGPTGATLGTNIAVTIPNPEPGFYQFIVTNTTNGCSNFLSFGIYPKLQMDVNVPQGVCEAGPIDIEIGFVDNDPPYTLQVSANGGPLLDYTSEIEPGLGHALFPYNLTETTAFHVVMTDASGCVGTFDWTTLLYQPDNTFTVAQDGCNPVAVTVHDNSTPTGIPVEYFWSNGASGPTISVVFSGWYFVTVEDAFGCDNIDSIYVTVDYEGVCGKIQGTVIKDNLDNCLPDTGEQPLSGWLVQAAGTETFYGTTDASGHYTIYVAPGSYTVSAMPPSVYWVPCGNDLPVNLPNPDDEATVDFLVKKLPSCPELTVDLSTMVLRRCQTNYYWVDYCNQGVETATDPYIVVDLDDFLNYNTASVPSTDLGNNVYQFDVDDLDPGECGFFWISVEVSCDAVLGQTHCSEAHIYPDSSCQVPNPLWSGASLELTAECDADSLRFTVTNIGTAPTTKPLDFVVIEDAVMYMQTPPPGPTLGIGESFLLPVPANGATWRMEVEQEPYHPLTQAPIAAVEGCGANFSTGFVNLFPLGDDPLFLDIDCTENVASYDPNDKQGLPVGYGNEHKILPNTELQYLIRFQNTGTDTAFNVVLRDTLSSFLDMATVRPGASSHPYQFEVYGAGVLRFTFNDILLPDSSTNQAASQGFVHFSVKPRAGLPLGTVIENTAAIYFDFNEPVLTNTVFHTLDSNFIEVSDVRYHYSNINMEVSPNPFDASLQLRLMGVPAGQPLTFQIMDAVGREINQLQFTAPSFVFKGENLPSGLYFFKIESEGRVLATGKVVRR